MKQTFIDYCNSIDIGEPIQRRIEDLLRIASQVCPEEIEDIFITEYVKDDGQRELQSLWFLSQSYAMETKNFIAWDNLDILSSKDAVVYMMLEKTNYDFDRATINSRLSFRVKFKNDLGADFKASGLNCDSLKQIFSKYIKPNLAL